MSVDNVKLFLAKLQENDDLQKKIIEIASQDGFNFTEADLVRVLENFVEGDLSEQEMKDTAGGYKRYR